MAKLSALQPADIRKVAIPVGDDDTLNIEADANALTIGLQKRVSQALATDDVEGFAAEFFTLVKKWDLEDDDGEILPFEPETIERFSVHAFGGVLDAVMSELAPNVGTPQKSRKR